MSVRSHLVPAHSPARRAPVACALFACVSVALSAGCGDASDQPADADAVSGNTAVEQPATAATARFDASWEDRACEIVTADTVAATFELPVGELDQSSLAASRCTYEWEAAERSLAVAVRVAEWSEDAAAAAEYFERATRSMSAAEVSSAMDRIRETAEEGGELDTAGKQAAAEGVTGALGAGGLSFQPVQGVGDQARFEAATGELHVREDNLYFVVSAYLGPDMALPAKLDGASIMQASEAWMQETAVQRQDAAVALATAAIAAL